MVTVDVCMESEGSSTGIRDKNRETFYLRDVLQSAWRPTNPLTPGPGPCTLRVWTSLDSALGHHHTLLVVEHHDPSQLSENEFNSKTSVTEFCSKLRPAGISWMPKQTTNLKPRLAAMYVTSQQHYTHVPLESRWALI